MKIAGLMFILYFILFANSFTNNLIEMLASFITFDDRPTSLLAPNMCWNGYKLTSMAKRMKESGVRVSTSMQVNRVEFYLQHVVVLADLDCPGSHAFLKKASEDGYFKSPYRWVILDLRNRGVEALEEVDALVDSDVVLVRKVGEGYRFDEVYKVSPNSTIIETIRSEWRPLKVNINNNKYNITQSNEGNLVSTETNTSDLDAIKRNQKIIVIDEHGAMKDYRKSKVLASRRNNLRKHTLTLVNVVTDSNETRKHLDDRLFLHQDSITKMSYGVVKICFDMLNATTELIFTHTWGYRDKDGNWQGIIDNLIKKKADLGSLTIFTQERMEHIDYIAMVGSTAVRFVFREPPLTYVTNIFTLPFSGAVWVAIFICVLGCSVFLSFTSKWEASVCTHQFQLNGSWADVLILVIGALLQQGCTLEPRYAAGRTVTLLLYIVLTILFAAYSANIVVLLRAPSSSIRTLPDLLNSPLKLGASDFEYNRYFFKKLNDPIRKAIYDKKVAPNGNEANFFSMKDGVEMIRQGLFGFHMEVNPGYRIIQETYQEDEKCDLVEIDYINENDPWVPGQKRSPFKDLFKISFIKIRETGIQANIHQRLNVPKPQCSGSVATFSSVGIVDMQPAMMATLYGMLLALAVLLLEIVHHRLMVMRKKKLKWEESTDSEELRNEIKRLSSIHQ